MVKNNLIEIDLQLFAENSEESSDMPDVEIENDGIEIEVDEEPAEAQEATDVPTEQASDNTEPEKEVEKTVPLKALEAERNKWKERLNDPKLKKALAALEKLEKATGKDADTLLKEMDDMEVQKLVDDGGMDEEKARLFVQQERRIKEVEFKLNKQQRDVEFDKLKSEIPEIDELREDIEEYAYAKNMSVEEAYWAKFGKQKVQDMERSIEQRIMNNLAKKQAARVDTTPNGQAEVKSKINLTPDEIALAKMAGMTPQEYFIFKTSSNVDQFKKAKKG